MLNGISLFTGYAGLDIALKEYVRPIIYCEIEKYAQGILLSRMDDESIPFAPVWNDVTTLDGRKFRGMVDIIYGGFPCQDISVAGKGAGLGGKRSGLFSEIIRLCKEASPQFIFLENVPAIRTRGSIQVQEALASIGYDTRWGVISAAEVGANHKRERWFCLATKRDMANTMCEGLEGQWESERVQEEQFTTDSIGIERDIPYSNGPRLQTERAIIETTGPFKHGALHSSWWAVEPSVARVANGVANRVDRIKALGNGVVPLQAKTAFEILMGRN